MKVAVIGGNGYIGKHLCFHLQKRGIDLSVYDVQDEERSNYKMIDITNPESVATIGLNIDYIFMFAGLTGTYIGFDKYQVYNSINEIGLLNLLDAVRKSPYRPKVVFPSTRLVYKGFNRPLKEVDEKETKTIYAVNKIACEGILQAYNQSFDIPYTIFRICVPYGNLLSNDYSFGTVGSFIKQCKAGNHITLYGGGSIKRTFTHIEDLCNQVVQGAINEGSNSEIYNIGGETLSLRDAAKLIAHKFGKNVVTVPWPEKDLRMESYHTYFDDTKIQKLLGGFEYKKFEDFANRL